MESIGKVARTLGIRSSALRYYEVNGLVRSARLPSGYRVYGEDAVSTLRFIRRAQRLGMSLAEIKELLSFSADGRQPCRRVRELARAHLREIDREMRELTTLRSQLRQLLRRKPSRPRAGEVCSLIQRGV